MKRTSRKATFALALLGVLGASVIAGCGGGGSNSSGSEKGSAGGSESEMATAGNSGGGTIGAANIEGLGTILVDSEGMAVYDFTVDKGTKSECYGGCETIWPPVTTTGKPTAGAGAMASALGTTKRKDGTEQVTYEGHPLYTYASDEAPGEVNGNEVEGTWFVLNEKGAQVMGQPTGGGAEESSGGGGYGY